MPSRTEALTVASWQVNLQACSVRKAHSHSAGCVLSDPVCMAWLEQTNAETESRVVVAKVWGSRELTRGTGFPLELVEIA